MLWMINFVAAYEFVRISALYQNLFIPIQYELKGGSGGNPSDGILKIFLVGAATNDREISS